MSTPALLACQQGQVVTVRITTEQLKLVSRACQMFAASNLGDAAIVEEMLSLADCCTETAADPGPEGTVHGFAL